MQTYFGVSVRAGYSHRVRKPVVNWQFAPYWKTLNIQFCELLPLQIQGAYWVSNHLCEAWRHSMIEGQLVWSFIMRLGFFMENSPDHLNLKLNKHLFNVILRAKGGLKITKLSNSRNIFDLCGLLKWHFQFSCHAHWRNETNHVTGPFLYWN